MNDSALLSLILAKMRTIGLEFTYGASDEGLDRALDFAVHNTICLLLLIVIEPN